MTSEFAALVESVGTGMPGVRACVLVSRDGLALGAHPHTEEKRAMGIWARLASLGEIERGFTVVGSEVWAYTRRGPYSALMLADAVARPSLLLDKLDQMLLVAEEGRQHRKDGLRSPAREGAAFRAEGSEARRFRFPLHREQRGTEAGEPVPARTEAVESAQPVPVAAAVEIVSLTDQDLAGDATATSPPELAPSLESTGSATKRVKRGRVPAPEPAPEPEPEREPGPEPEVDHLALAREFAGLITESEGQAQG
jgi:hypothetical protein